MKPGGTTQSDASRIDGYRIWRGRQLLHARFVGSMAAAKAYGLPWHVVGSTVAELRQKIAPGCSPDQVFGRW